VSRNYRGEGSRRGTTSQRGYGAFHQQARARVAPLVAAGRAICTRCRRPIKPGEPWDLDHADLPGEIAQRFGVYRGPSHRSCNISARNRRQRSRPRALQFFDTPSANKRQRMD
jgi:hypothetical protein